ncbi:hypothetical protein DLJ53_04350 [Acuticoccus sediminis]|uniref:CAAX prenyl protease 2/Lysostaphin resistance protein A-like domain-containing protein n=1 Tax=Acuticoccus sediminis TaxID=2184697 RepID=A0A8B2P554_9HYPH|nr:CPBP family glutamic-type intramembrane protease [Acuticoccus sediminis]RAI03719.1 hypothetical protein DLJ53_04350 [Acuticoccus sediminis]
MTSGRLIACGVALIPAALVAVLVLTGWWPGGLEGYLAVLALYWLFYCIPVGLASGAFRLGISFKVKRAVWAPVLVLVQALSFVAYGLAKGFAEIPLETMAIGALLAFINAPLEEFAWRGAYLSVARRNPLIQAVGVWLFALWHVPMMMATGITFSESAASVVFGTFMFGSVWALAAFWTGGIGWGIVGHVIVNMVAFPALIAGNG